MYQRIGRLLIPRRSTAWGGRRPGQPTVRKQRDKWVVRVDGIDTATGKHRPRQLGTYASQRAALAAARSGQADRRSTERGTVSWLVRRYVAGRTDITLKSRESYEWAIPHIEAGLGAIPVARLDREDVAEWIEGLGGGGRALAAQCADLPHRPARRARRGRRRGDHPAQPGRPGRAPPNRRQAGEGQGDRSVGHRRRDPLPRGDPRAPLGRRVPPRRALRTPPQRGARAPLGRPRPRRADPADRPEPRRRQHGRRMERRQERAITAADPAR